MKTQNSRGDRVGEKSRVHVGELGCTRRETRLGIEKMGMDVPNLG